MHPDVVRPLGVLVQLTALDVAPLLLGPVRCLAPAARLAVTAVRSATRVAERLDNERTRTLFLGAAAHSLLPLDPSKNTAVSGPLGDDGHAMLGPWWGTGRDEDAVTLLNGIKAKVNLLPLNEAAGIPYERPSDARVNRFAQIVAERGLTVSVRKSRGRDIRAACGQLITESARQKSPGQRLATLIQV